VCNRHDLLVVAGLNLCWVQNGSVFLVGDVDGLAYEIESLARNSALARVKGFRPDRLWKTEAIKERVPG